MSIQTPPTLQKLARLGLLRNQIFTLYALEVMPIMLFPSLFKEAFSRGLTRIVKAMVKAWPFPYLPVGALIKTFHLKIVMDLLDGLRVILTEDINSRGKLRVIDFRSVHHEFWNVWPGTVDGDLLAETVSEKQTVKPPARCELRQRLKVMTDLCFRFQLDREETFFLHLAQWKRDSLQFCCVNMKIVLLSLDDVREVLSIFKPEHIQVLELKIDWCWYTLSQFSPYLYQMRNLHTLKIEGIHRSRCGVFHIPTSYDMFAEKFVVYVSGLSSLQHLYLNGISFLSRHMKRLLKNLKMPLQSFSVTHCQLFQSHLTDISQCERLHQLKHLDMSGVLLFDLCMMPLRVLLENVADTLETLELQGCRMSDSQLSVLLPALGQCSQLTKVNLYTNDFSMNVLSDLLHHTANLSKMTMGKYPAPQECYDELGYVSIGRFVQLCSVLMDTVRVLRQPKRISFATNECSRCFKRCVYDQEIRLCSCLQ